jgi:hypothetical protein
MKTKSRKPSPGLIRPGCPARRLCRTVPWNPGKHPSLVPRPLTHRSRKRPRTWGPRPSRARFPGLEIPEKRLDALVPPAGFEPATPALGVLKGGCTSAVCGPVSRGQTTSHARLNPDTSAVVDVRHGCQMARRASHCMNGVDTFTCRTVRCRWIVLTETGEVLVFELRHIQPRLFGDRADPIQQCIRMVPIQSFPAEAWGCVCLPCCLMGGRA